MGGGQKVQESQRGMESEVEDSEEHEITAETLPLASERRGHFNYVSFSSLKDRKCCK